MNDVAAKREKAVTVTSVCPIDTDALLARCTGNRSFALRLLWELERTGNERVAVMGVLTSLEEFDALAEAAHSLKGTVAVLAAGPLRELTTAVEIAAKARNRDQLKDLIRQLGYEMRRCLKFISVFRASPVTSGQQFSTSMLQ